MNHCWHYAFAKMDWEGEPRWEQVCCWCGAKRWQCYQHPEGHGPSLPAAAMSLGPIVYEYEEGVLETCPDRPEGEEN